MGWGEAGRRSKREGDICIHTADSFHCAEETKSKFVKQLYPTKNPLSAAPVEMPQIPPTLLLTRHRRHL